MIADVLSRSFVMSWLDPVEGQLQELVTTDADGRCSDALQGLSEVRAVGLPGQGGDEDGGDGRRGKPESGIDEAAFFSRRPLTRLLQSAIDQHVESQYSDLIVEETGAARRDEDDRPAVTDRRLISGDGPVDGVVSVQHYDECGGRSYEESFDATG